MNSAFNYLIEANLCLLTFGLFYYLALKNDTHFRFIRYYLLGSALFALAIPLLRFDNPFVGNDMEPLVSGLPTITIPELVVGAAYVTEAPAEAPSWSWIAGLLYGGVVIILFTLFIYQAYQIIRFRGLKRNVTVRTEDYVFIPTDGQLPTFSFFNMLFFDDTMVLSEPEKQKIIEHELVHIRQRHTLDILVLEVIKILFWINPVAWWMRKNIQDVHEYLADQKVLRSTNHEQYSSLLARMALKDINLPLGHHFNRSLTLKRIKMMKSPKTKMKLWKWAITIPLVMTIAFALSCNSDMIDDVNIETDRKSEMPESIQPELEKIQQKYPEAAFFYLEANGTTIDDLKKFRDFDPMNIAHVQVWQERERIGAIIVDNHGSLKAPEPKTKKDKDGIYTKVEKFAKPEGGRAAFYKHMADVIKYPLAARKAGIEGVVYVQFIVETDGKLTDLTVVRGIGHGCDKAALEAIRTAPSFNPAYQDGKAVRQRLLFPITFKLSNSDRKNVISPKADTIANKLDEMVVVGYN